MFKSAVFSQFSERLHHKTMKPANPLQLTCPTDQFYNYRPVLQTNLTTTDQSYLYRPVLPLQTSLTTTDQFYHYRPVLQTSPTTTDSSGPSRPMDQFILHMTTFWSRKRDSHSERPGHTERLGRGRAHAHWFINESTGAVSCQTATNHNTEVSLYRDLCHQVCLPVSLSMYCIFISVHHVNFLR